MTKQKKQRQKQIQGFFATLRMTSGEEEVLWLLVFVILPMWRAGWMATDLRVL
jgi:hypothetical protein